MAELQAYNLHQAQLLVEDATRRAVSRHNRWRQLEHMFRTGQAEGAVTSQHLPGHLWTEQAELTLDAINYALPHLTIIIETIAARDPELVVEPFAGGPPAEQGAKIGQQILAYYWRWLRITPRVLRDMAHDAVVIGNGFCKLGWAHDEEEVDRDPLELEEELADLLEADDAQAKLEERRPSPPDELIDELVTTEHQILTDEPYVEYVSPYDIFVPDNARRMEETPWVAQRMVMPSDEVRSNPAFNQAAIDDLETMSQAEFDPQRVDDGRPRANSGGDSDQPDGNDPFEHAELYEFYDMRSRQLLVFQTNADTPLYEGELPYSHRHPPFVHLRNFNDGGSRFWAFGDLENIAAIQHQYNEYVAEQMDNARRSGNKTVVDKNAWDEGVRELLETDQHDVAAPVDTNNRPLSELLHTIERPGLSNDVYQAKDELRIAMQEVLGLNDFQTGGTGADRMSATAAAVADGTATLRSAGKREAVEQAAQRIGLKLLLLCQEFMAPQRAVRVSGPQGAAWLDVSLDDIQGEYLVKVEVGSTESVNPSTRKQEAMEIAGTIIPAIEASGYDPDPLWRHVIRDLGYDPEHVLQRAPQPQMPAPAGGGPPGGPGGAEPPGPPGGGAEGPDRPQGPTEQMRSAGGPPVPADTSGQMAL